MRKRALAVALLGALATPALANEWSRATQPARSTPPTWTSDVFAFVRAMDEAGTRDVWPGFNTSQLPIALFDGEQTILLRHPSPPPEFTPMPGRPGVLVASGRYPAVVSNSTRDIGGVRTATVIATPGQAVESTMLACVEEVFHVFWLGRHSSFRPDEMARYAYPVKDVENLRSMLAEDEALARALGAESHEEAARWAAAALQFRRDRTPRLTDDARAFERALEMMEGTANYVARRAVGESPAQTSARLRKGRPAEGVRWRFYDTGTALCLLLDRFEPDWKVRIDSQPDLTTVDLLGAALTRRAVEPKSFSTTEAASFEARAAADVADLASRQQQLRKELLDRPGPRVIVEVSEGVEPFRVQRFDPINLLVLDAGEVVHAAFITLTGANGTVEVKNPGFARNSFAGTISLTEAAGRHPLRDGIRQMTIVGVQGAPRVGREDGTVTLDAPGLHIVLPGVEVRTDSETIRLTIPGRSR